MSTQTVGLRHVDRKIDSIQWDQKSPLTASISTRPGTLQVRYGRFVGGLSDGVEVIEVDTGAVKAMILPTRGMSIWNLEVGRVRFGWNSPVAGPIHPNWVPIRDPSGLGWLEGFDELLVRCGLESNGAPQHDEQGRLQYPLHGCIANRPADSLWLEYDEPSGRLEIIGEVLESRLFFKNLRMRSRIRFTAGRPDVEVLDDVTNLASTPTTIQMLYHINIGAPILAPGSQVEASLKELAPKDALSASEIDTWNLMPGPQSSYTERVYFGRMHDGETGEAATMLRTAKRDLGLGVTYRTATLPYFILWKNPAANEDGYVVGLEPSANLPNARGFEQSQGRVLEIGPGQTIPFRVALHPLLDQESVEQFSEKISTLLNEDASTVHREPKKGWSVSTQ